MLSLKPTLVHQLSPVFTPHSLHPHTHTNIRTHRRCQLIIIIYILTRAFLVYCTHPPLCLTFAAANWLPAPILYILCILPAIKIAVASEETLIKQQTILTGTGVEQEYGPIWSTCCKYTHNTYRCIYMGLAQQCLLVFKKWGVPL